MCTYIYVVMGKSSVGKDTIVQRLLNDSELDLNPIVLHTTREQRVGEIDGVNYNFVSEFEMNNLINNNLMIEYREYNTTKGKMVYGTSSTAIKSGYSYITINTLDGFKSMRDYYKRKTNVVVMPIYIEVDDYTRLSRSIERARMERIPDFAECCRRYLADEDDFSKLKVEKEIGDAFIIQNVGDLDDVVKKIKDTLILPRSYKDKLA